jgi:SAM-dependent methyltransferase
MDIREYNQQAWDHLVEERNRWTVPVSSEEIERARNGDWQVLLTPTRPVPTDWFPDLQGRSVLCLASGGGQQGPILAAAGARVTILDNSPQQLEQDRAVARRDQLELQTTLGNMANLSPFDEKSFDLIFHPCANCFVPDVRPVWQECFRVLCPGGCLLAGFINPVRYLFDQTKMDAGRLEVRHAIPYSDLADLTPKELQAGILDHKQPVEFGHSLTDQVAGQLDAGFVITGFYEDHYESDSDALSNYLQTFIATRAKKPPC